MYPAPLTAVIGLLIRTVAVPDLRLEVPVLVDDRKVPFKLDGGLIKAVLLRNSVLFRKGVLGTAELPVFCGSIADPKCITGFGVDIL